MTAHGLKETSRKGRNTPMDLQLGQRVRVKSLAGIELGRITSINEKSGKVDIYFDYPSCPHHCTFNINQVVEVVA